MFHSSLIKPRFLMAVELRQPIRVTTRKGKRKTNRNLVLEEGEKEELFIDGNKIIIIKK